MVSEMIMIIVVSLGICVILPVMIVWLIMRHKTNETNRRTEIVLAAIERNPDIDVEEIFQKLMPKQKTAAERLVNKLCLGCIFSFLGLAFAGVAWWVLNYGESAQSVGSFAFFAFLFFSMGASFLIGYFVQKRMMKKTDGPTSLSKDA